MVGCIHRNFSVPKRGAAWNGIIDQRKQGNGVDLHKSSLPEVPLQSTSAAAENHLDRASGDAFFRLLSMGVSALPGPLFPQEPG